MKEQTPDYQHPESNWIYSGEGRCLEVASSGSQAPGPRFKHQSFMYKGRLYVHGGTTIPSSDFTDDPLDLHCYHFEGEAAGHWERIRTKLTTGKELELFSAHAATVIGNKWYVFGGSNNECRPNNLLMRLNLDSYQWTRMQQKGQVPFPRESAYLVSLQKNWLLLYGGLSTVQVEIYNTFHFYNLDTRNWSLCEGSYQYQVYARLDPALCYFKDRLYMFGGTYRTIANQEHYLDDFYEITVNPPARNQAGRVQMKRLASSRAPEGRSGHCLVGVGQHHLALICGENTSSQLKDGLRYEQVSLLHSMWMFDTRSATWNVLELALRGFRFRTMTTCINRNDHLYLFGGLHSYSAVLNDLVELTIDPHALTSLPRVAKPCLNCAQRARFPPVLRHFPATVVEEVSQSIDFPFAAFGLLIDNAMSNGAGLLKISYLQALGMQKTKLLKFEDDARLNWSDEELLETVKNFNSGPLSAPAGTDKKIKLVLHRQQARRDYGCNLKAASLRLGNGFLFISFSAEDSIFRVYFMEKQDSDFPTERYTLYYYNFNILDRKVCKPEMEATRIYITGKYGDLIDGVFFNRKSRNTLFVFNPRIQDTREVVNLQEQVELKADVDNSNILNGSLAKIKQLQRQGFVIQECVDVSLKAYITCLYLKNEQMKIMLSVKQLTSHPIEVQTQSFLQKVDRQCKQKHVLQINQAFEFDLKITEIYYLYNIQRKSNFFSNGLLIYHKNRLITRFKYPLGELITRKFYKHKNIHNFLRLFGFIELPDHVPVNLFKTTYLHHIMMEKLLSRLKFIAKSFKQEMFKMAKNPDDYRRPAPTKLNEEEAQQERNELSEPKPPKERVVKPQLGQVQREISLRKKKDPHTEALQMKLRHLLKDPTSDNIKSIMKLIERNSDHHDEIGHTRNLFPSGRTGGVRPVANSSCAKPFLTEPSPEGVLTQIKQQNLLLMEEPRDRQQNINMQELGRNNEEGIDGQVHPQQENQPQEYKIESQQNKVDKNGQSKENFIMPQNSSVQNNADAKQFKDFKQN